LEEKRIPEIEKSRRTYLDVLHLMTHDHAPAHLQILQPAGIGIAFRMHEELVVAMVLGRLQSAVQVLPDDGLDVAPGFTLGYLEELLERKDKAKKEGYER
jgi:hypothetical protein